MREKKDIRLFFALWPDEALRRRLNAAAKTIPLPAAARRVPYANLHMTLHFIGNVYFDDMECMQGVARRVEATRFSLEVDCQGYFAKPRVAWLGCSEVPTELGELHRQLGEHLQTCGYRPESRPYHPHVTVMRKVKSVAESAGFDPVGWTVNEFVLVEVRTVENGVEYRVVESYPLK